MTVMQIAGKEWTKIFHKWLKQGSSSNDWLNKIIIKWFLDVDRLQPKDTEAFVCVISGYYENDDSKLRFVISEKRT